MKHCASLVVMVALVCAACGDDGNLAEPAIVEGGGLTGGGIDGKVNLYVIDQVTDNPISGADVYLGEPGEQPITGVTDSSGLFSIDDGNLSGPTTVTVIAAGFVAATWFGADAVNMTVPLDPLVTGNRTPAQAEVSGSITGWEAMAAPDANHMLIAIIGPTQSRNLDDDANDLPQPPGMGGLPANACVRSAQLSTCDWTANVRAGQIGLVATIIDLDTKGNADESDDTTELVGYGYRLGLTVEDGVTQSGLALTMVDVADLTEVAVTTELVPTGLDNVGVLLQMDLGDDGYAQLYGGEDPAASIVVPALTGPFADASMRALSFAQMGDGDSAPSSVIVRRGITDLSADIAMGAWLPLPGSLAEAGGEYSFTAVDAALHVVDFSDDTGTAWNVVLLDGRTSFTLPGVTPSPLPSSGYDMNVTGFDANMDLTDFRIDDFDAILERVSDSTLSIAP